MAAYSVTLRSVRTGQVIEYSNVIFDDVIRFDVKFDSDGKVTDPGRQGEFRYVVLETRERIEFPMKEYLVQWGKERQDILDEAQKRMSEPRINL